MSTLAEIEAATDSLPEAQKEELFAFLAARLGRTHVLLRPPKTEEVIPMPPGNPRVVASPRTGLPVIQCTPGNVIDPTKEQLSEC